MESPSLARLHAVKFSGSSISSTFLSTSGGVLIMPHELVRMLADLNVHAVDELVSLSMKDNWHAYFRDRLGWSNSQFLAWLSTVRKHFPEVFEVDIPDVAHPTDLEATIAMFDRAGFKYSREDDDYAITLTLDASGASSLSHEGHQVQYLFSKYGHLVGLGGRVKDA